MADNFYKHQNSQSEGLTRTIALYGEHKGGSGGVNHANEGTALVVGNQQAPYKKPKRRLKDDPTKLLCIQEGCKAYPMKTEEYCSGHARSLGLIENWSTKKV